MGGGVETVMRGTRCPLKGHSMRVGADVGYENAVSKCHPTSPHFIGDPP